MKHEAIAAPLDMKTYSVVEYVKLRPHMYCPEPENGNIVFETVLIYGKKRYTLFHKGNL